MGKYTKEVDQEQEETISKNGSSQEKIKKKIKTVKDGEGKKRRHRGRHHAKKSEKKTTTKVERPKRNKNIGSLRQLSKYKDLISLLADGDMKDNTKFTIMNSLHDREFNSICKCVHDILYDKGPMKGKIHDSQFSHLTDTLTPYKKDLRKFASKNVPIKTKKRMLKKSQDGGESPEKGGATLGSIISTLLPIATQVMTAFL